MNRRARVRHPGWAPIRRYARAAMSVAAVLGAVASVFVLATWFGSGWYGVGWINSADQTAYFLDGGIIAEFRSSIWAEGLPIHDQIWQMRTDEAAEGKDEIIRGRLFALCCSDYLLTKDSIVLTRDWPTRFGLSQRWRRIKRGGAGGLRGFVCPLWLVFLCTALPPTMLWLLRPRVRFPTGHCQTCGYNLTGNVSGVCPECGTKIDTGPSAPPAKDEPRRGDSQ